MALILDKSTPLTLAQTMGTIMAAIIDAEAESARTTVEFIREVGFIKDPKAKSGAEKLRTVKFGYKKLDENNTVSDFTIDIPLLGMVNIPMVSVKNATFSFSYEISSAVPQKTKTGGTLSLPVNLADIKGRVAKENGSGKESASLKVTVELERPQNPVGVERILDILELSASESKNK